MMVTMTTIIMMMVMVMIMTKIISPVTKKIPKLNRLLPHQKPGDYARKCQAGPREYHCKTSTHRHSQSALVIIMIMMMFIGINIMTRQLYSCLLIHDYWWRWLKHFDRKVTKLFLCRCTQRSKIEWKRLKREQMVRREVGETIFLLCIKKRVEHKQIVLNDSVLIPTYLIVFSKCVTLFFFNFFNRAPKRPTVSSPQY